MVLSNEEDAVNEHTLLTRSAARSARADKRLEPTVPSAFIVEILLHLG